MLEEHAQALLSFLGEVVGVDEEGVGLVRPAADAPAVLTEALDRFIRADETPGAAWVGEITGRYGHDVDHPWGPL